MNSIELNFLSMHVYAQLYAVSPVPAPQLSPINQIIRVLSFKLTHQNYTATHIIIYTHFTYTLGCFLIRIHRYTLQAKQYVKNEVKEMALY